MRQSYKDYEQQTQAVQNVLIINLEKINTNINTIINIKKVEKVNVNTGEKRVLYQIEDNQEFGPGVGAVSYSPIKNEIAF